MTQPGSQGSPPGSEVCPGCGWANAAGARTCDFCRMPLKASHDPRAAPNEPARPAARPATSAGRAPVPTRTASHAPVGVPRPAPPPDDGEGSLLERLGIEITPGKIVFAVIVLTGVGGFLFQLSLQNKSQTADHVRQIKKMLEIYEGETGGYPENLDVLERRTGPIPAFFRQDAWKRALRYTVSGTPRQSFEGQGLLYPACDLRSAGSNGKFEDDDDVFWKGQAGK